MSDAPEARPSVPGVELSEPLIRTNLSELWKGVRKHDGAPVVVKFATPASSPEMLRQEAQTVQALRKAGIPRIIPAEYGDEPVPHLVFPWMGSRTLRDSISEIRGGDARSRAMEIYFGLLETVVEVHREGFLHGDLKPENVIIDGDGRPWLTDFGMARAIRAARLDTRISLSMSRSEGGWGGTLHYLPPEGLHGEAPAPAWDIYALGVILHEVLLGSRPDRAATPEHLKSVLPEEVVQVLLDALAYAPEDRIPGAATLLARLRRLRSEITAVGASRWMRRGFRLALAGLAAFFVALRYGMVTVLVAGYAAILVGAYFQPALLIAYLPFLLLHVMVRWEGPETAAEVALRMSGNAVRRR